MSIRHWGTDRPTAGEAMNANGPIDLSVVGSTAAFLVLLALKLEGTIAWSWWWVVCPLWIPWVIVIAVLVVGFAVEAVALLREKRSQ